LQLELQLLQSAAGLIFQHIENKGQFVPVICNRLQIGVGIRAIPGDCGCNFARYAAQSIQPS